MNPRTTRRGLRESLIAPSGRGALNPSREAVVGLHACQGLGNGSANGAFFSGDAL